MAKKVNIDDLVGWSGGGKTEYRLPLPTLTWFYGKILYYQFCGWELRVPLTDVQEEARRLLTSSIIESSWQVLENCKPRVFKDPFEDPYKNSQKILSRIPCEDLY
jgi:hypothetical protein